MSTRPIIYIEKENGLINDMKYIDHNFLNVDEKSIQSKLFHKLIEENKILILKIVESLKKYTITKKYLKSYFNHISDHIDNKINYNNLKYIKNKEIHTYSIIACSIIWSFNDNFKNKYNNINNLYNCDSYSIINESINFIQTFKIWNVINEKTLILNHISKKDHNDSFYRIFSILIHEKIILTETNYIRWLNKKIVIYRSDFFNAISIVKIYTKPYKYKKIQNNSILIGEHYSCCWELFIPSNLNGSSFNLFEDEVINIMTELFTNIDFEHYEELYNIYLEDQKLEHKNIEIEYEKYLINFKIAIKQNNKNLTSQLSKKMSIYQKAIELKTILEYKSNKNEKFFLPWNLDFRGRAYFLSDLSFTFIKEFRWCMYQEYYENINDFKPIWHTYNTKIFKILEENIELIDKINNFIPYENIYIKHTILWLLISLGEINKQKIGAQINIKTFILEGIKIFNTFEITNNQIKYENKIKAVTIIKMIKELNKNIIWPLKKRLISKDAPASVFQHLVLNFGWNNTNTLKECNLLSNDTWYDTYSIFIKKWKETKILNKNQELILKFLFNRESLKKVIMTVNYGVSYNSAENYFNDVILNLKIEDPEYTENFLEKNWNEIKNLFDDFFNFLSKWNILKCPPEEIIKFIKNDNGIIKLKDACVDINYYKKKKYTIDILHEGKRYTKSFDCFTEEKDWIKFETATRANYIHSIDAALIRWIIKKHGVYTIHDCFLIDIANITFLISLVNEGMNEKFHNFYKLWETEKIEIFSLFILL